MLVEDKGKNNSIVIKRPEDAPGYLKISGNNSMIDIGRVNGPLEVTVDGDGGSLQIDNAFRVGRLKIGIKNGASVKILGSCSFEECYILADGADVTIGKDCMVSYQVSIRTTDAHGIYDLTTGKLINQNEPIVIGDHVWLGQGVMVAKGTTIGKNSIVGARSYLSKISVKENCIIAGTPPRILRENVIWDRRMTDNIFAEDAFIDPQLKDHLKNIEARRRIQKIPDNRDHSIIKKAKALIRSLKAI